MLMCDGLYLGFLVRHSDLPLRLGFEGEVGELVGGHDHSRG
jgi:hypothetical protein